MQVIMQVIIESRYHIELLSNQAAKQLRDIKSSINHPSDHSFDRFEATERLVMESIIFSNE